MEAKTKLTKGECFQKSAKCENNHSSPMSNISWCDLNIKANLLKVHDMCLNPNCKCQKQITFTPRKFEVEGSRFNNTMEKILQGLKKSGINSLGLD